MTHYSLSTQRLTRSPHGYLGGVCEGLGQRFSIEPNLLRVAWLFSTLIIGTGALLYLALWWLLPRSDDASFEPTIWTEGKDGQRHPPRSYGRRPKIFGSLWWARKAVGTGSHGCPVGRVEFRGSDRTVCSHRLSGGGRVYVDLRPAS